MTPCPIFARYDAHATLAGHMAGLHAVHHRSADVAFKEDGCSAFRRDEVTPDYRMGKELKTR